MARQVPNSLKERSANRGRRAADVHRLRFAAGVEHSRTLAARQWRRVREMDPETQDRRILGHTGYRTWGLVELLCRESVAAASLDPGESRRLSSLAGHLAYELFEEPPVWADRPRSLQLTCLALAHLGNALRLQAELADAEEVFDEVEEAWRVAAPEDPLGYRPRILELLASLRRVQRRFSEAVDVLDAVIGHHRAKHPSKAVRALIIKAKTLNEMDRPGAALQCLENASHLLEAAGEPALDRTVLHNRALYLAAAGRAEEAARLLPRIREAFAGQAGSTDAIRVDWVAARIAQAQGRRDQARWLLEKVRNRFSRTGMAFDTALAALELACLAAEDGDSGEVRRVARTLIPIFEQRQVHREALAALRLFHYAALEERVDGQILRSVHAYLKAARDNPTLKFDGLRDCRG